MQIKEVYGNSYTKLLKSISSSGKSMFIEFKFQTPYGYLEFNSSIMYNNISSDCQTWLDMEKNILTSPNQSCSWLITANFRSHIILNFTYIEVRLHTCVPLLESIILKLPNSSLIIACNWIWLHQDLWWWKWICRKCENYYWDSQSNCGVNSWKSNVCEFWNIFNNQKP